MTEKKYKEKAKTKTVTLPFEVHKWFKQKAAKEGMNLQDVFLEAAQLYMQQETKNKTK